MVCHTTEWGACSGAAPACDEDGNCEPAPEPECETGTTSQCVYKWETSCEVDADCGEGFTCKQEEAGCDCASSGGGSDPAVPEEGDEGGDAMGDGGRGEEHGADGRAQTTTEVAPRHEAGRTGDDRAQQQRGGQHRHAHLAGVVVGVLRLVIQRHDDVQVRAVPWVGLNRQGSAQAAYTLFNAARTQMQRVQFVQSKLAAEVITLAVVVYRQVEIAVLALHRKQDMRRLRMLVDVVQRLAGSGQGNR